MPFESFLVLSLLKYPLLFQGGIIKAQLGKKLKWNKTRKNFKTFPFIHFIRYNSSHSKCSWEQLKIVFPILINCLCLISPEDIWKSNLLKKQEDISSGLHQKHHIITSKQVPMSSLFIISFPQAVICRSFPSMRALSSLLFGGITS